MLVATEHDGTLWVRLSDAQEAINLAYEAGYGNGLKDAKDIEQLGNQDDMSKETLQ